MVAMQQHHILVVTYPLQGHINPALHLAKRLARTTGARITFSTAVSAHRKMFPSLSTPNQEIIDDDHDDLITYIPFSDGYDEGFKVGQEDAAVLSQFKLVGSSTLSSIIDNLRSRGSPVTCLIYTFMVSWAADVATQHRIPFAQYWIQPATVFAIYYHYFHGYDKHVAECSNDLSRMVELPGLPPMQLRHLPSFITAPVTPDDPLFVVVRTIKEAFLSVDRSTTQYPTEKKPKVLVNTFDELESEALRAVENLELVGVGPVLPSFPKESSSSSSSRTPGFDLFKPDGKGYIEWLDSKTEKSVVYVSFGSLSVVQKQQMEEILKGLKASGRPYLWVVRKDSRDKEMVLEDDENGMVVEWCSQLRVLAHPSVGCFVTHCGWNSTMESLVCGVPTICVPQWTDQGTNAMLVEKSWGTGVRGEINDGKKVLEGDELERCLDVVMGEGARGADIRRNAEMWKKKAKEAVREGGSSDRNLKAFLDDITIFHH